MINVRTFIADCTEDEQACKVLEEAAEVFAAWQTYQPYNKEPTCSADLDGQGAFFWAKRKKILHMMLADEIADVIQVACNLAERYGCFEQVEMCHMELANVGVLGSKCDDKAMAVAVLQKATLLYSYWWRSADMFDKSLTEAEKRGLASKVDGLIMYAIAFAERFGIDVAAAMQRCEQRNRERGRYGTN